MYHPYLNKANAVINTEVEGLNALSKQLDQSFVDMVDICLKALKQGGKLAISGIGKSGHIGHKIAATLTSTGSPAVPMNPVEAVHGDLGLLTENDVLLALSYSGETEELLNVLPAAKRLDIPIIAITGNPESQLARWADLSVSMTIPHEACPFKLAPTTSTTALLALGDALAMVLLEVNGFSKENYAKFHPSGSIGRSLSLRVVDIMRPKGKIPLVLSRTIVKDALFKMTECRSGSVIVIDEKDQLLGIFTDGDLRRHIQNNLKILECPVQDVMTLSPTTINQDDMAISILHILEKEAIDDLPVIDRNNRVVGLIDIQDLPKFKLI